MPRFVGEGDNTIRQVRWKDGKVSINSRQYFDGVPEEVWSYRIGGYQVLGKWLSARKGRALSGKDIETVQKIIQALCETVSIQEVLARIADQAEIF